MTLLQKYERALEVAQSNEKLQCLILQIQQTIGKLKCEGYKPTSSEEVWVDYFLEKNDREECKNNSVKHPCQDCVYFKVCGSSSRTEPCEGRRTKRLQQGHDGKFDEVLMVNQLSRMKEECSIPPVEMIERERVAYVSGMEKYLQELKSMDRSDAQKKSFKNLVQCGVIQENGGN